MSTGNTFEQYGLRQAAPGLTPFDSLRVDPFRDTSILTPRDAVDVHAPHPQQLVVSGEVFHRGIYQLPTGTGLLPVGGTLPSRFMRVSKPFDARFPHGINWNAKTGPVAFPVTEGELELPETADDLDNAGHWVVYGNHRDGRLKFFLNLSPYNHKLLFPQSDLPPIIDTHKQAATVFDMSQRPPPQETKPIAVPKAIEAQPKTPSKPALKPDQPKRKSRSMTLPPRQRALGLSFLLSTPATVMSAPLIANAPEAEIAAMPSVYKPKAGDTGKVALRGATVVDFQDPLDFRGAREEKGFWELPPYAKEFWNKVIDGKKPFKGIPVVFHDEKRGTVYFVPKNKPIQRVRCYPNGVDIDAYHEPEVFDRGGVLANQICFIPLAGSSHEGIVYPVNGSCDIWGVVPNHKGEYDFSDGKNRTSLPVGSTVIRREDGLQCEFDPLDDPNIPYATYRLFAPGSRGTAVSNLSPQEAQRQFMNHHYRLKDRERRKQDRLKRAGTVFSVRF